MKFVVISSNLKKDSKTLILAQETEKSIKKLGHKAELLNLAEIDLPFCDGDKCYNNAKVKELHKTIENSDGIILSTPIYNYNVNAAAKNLFELTGKAWLNKPVGFTCSAGGSKSYMSIMSFANSLMLDFRCTIIPKFVYVTDSSFEGDEITDPDVSKRIEELAASIIKFAKVLK
ncbi:MAG TPA: NADPH-dependent FMN reductase [archaeon]|nr:NADPH-dependent FMN reductase [archaeon]